MSQPTNDYPAHADHVYDNDPRQPYLGDPDFVAGTNKKQTEGRTN